MTKRQPPTENPSGSNRRNFLKTAATTAAAAAWLRPSFTIAAERARGANERLGVGFIGTGGRAGAHIDICLGLKAAGRCETVAVCDIYGPRVRAAAQKTGGKIYRNYKELLADPAVDVVCIATPDRHHAPQAIEAIRAGKDVYCEKPLTHWSQMDLARQVGEEAAKHKRIVQVGTQYVADDAYAEIRKLIQDGIVGKIVHVQAGYFRRGDWGERMEVPDANAKPGPDLDWQQFLGDAPKVDFSVSRFFQWRMFWDYAGGPATDLLVHTFTPIFCLLDLGFPDRVLGGGGTFQYNREVPDQCNIIVDYAGGPSVVLMNSLSNFTGISTILRGTDGLIEWKQADHPDNKGVRIVPNGKPETFIPWKGMGDTGRLWSNFLDCVKSRQRPYSPIDMAVRVQAPLNMGILSHRENKVARFDKEKQQIVL
ncbi:MAG: Gfo/Idh/MocA family protein [Pirellulales bacterium]